jgi:hypothetical protein
MILFDKENIYHVDINAKTCKAYTGHNVMKAITLPDGSVYAFCKASQEQELPAGLRLYNIKAILTKGRCEGQTLKEVDISA